MNIANVIGNTPLVEVPGSWGNSKIYCKLEGNNPAGSVKDRPAFAMISKALERGDIISSTQLIEPTSGNTGIALSMAASLFGLSITLVMPANASAERVKTMEAFGATVVLTDASSGMEGAIDYAREKVVSDGAFMLNQFGNPDNWKSHYETTGPEIWNGTNGEITHFVSAMGTTGTIMGVSRYLKEKNPAIQIVGCQPSEGSNIPGIRRWPKEYLPAIFEPERVDRIIDVSQDEAKAMTRRMAKEFGIFAGMSSGGALHVAMKVASENTNARVVTITCDRGDRYLSTEMFN